MYKRWSLMAVVIAMAGCSQISHTEQTISTPTNTSNTSPVIAKNSGFYKYGYDQGCGSALNGKISPAEALAKAAPGLTGTKADYQAGWSAGMQRCRNGLGPAQLPKDSEKLQNPALYNFGYDLGCKDATVGTNNEQSGLTKAPIHTGSDAPYFLGWKEGYKSCTIPTHGTPPPAPNTAHPFTDMFQYGYSEGCKGAIDNTLTPQQGLITPPILQGTKKQYLSGWQLGYHNCRVNQNTPAVN